MTRYGLIQEYKTKNYIVSVKKDYEEISPFDLFDETVTDIKSICEKIDQGINEWITLFIDIKKYCKCCNEYREIGNGSLGGILIEDKKDLLDSKYITQVMSMAREGL